MKPTRSLTGDLLVQKGRAAPFAEQIIAQISPQSRGRQYEGYLIANGQEASPQRASPLPQEARGQKEGTKKAAMTLRLDDTRHVRLRLLSALQGRSCQQLLIEALDALLERQATELDPHILRCLNRLGEK